MRDLVITRLSGWQCESPWNEISNETEVIDVHIIIIAGSHFVSPLVNIQ